MAAVGAYECSKCGGLRFSCEGMKNPPETLKPYTKKHVCKKGAK